MSLELVNGVSSDTQKKAIPKGFRRPAQGCHFWANPGLQYRKKSNLKRGCVTSVKAAQAKPAQPFQGCEMMPRLSPGLAEKRQPWAGGLNPFGILSTKH